MLGSRGSGAASPYSWMLTGCQSWKVISTHPSERLATHARPGVLLAAADVVREVVVDRDVIHRRRRLRVPVAPRRAAIRRDNGALVRYEQHDVRIVRIDPALLVVVAARCTAHGTPGPAAVFAAPEHGRATVDHVGVLRIDCERVEIAAADATERAGAPVSRKMSVPSALVLGSTTTTHQCSPPSVDLYNATAPPRPLPTPPPPRPPRPPPAAFAFGAAAGAIEAYSVSPRHADEDSTRNIGQ